MHYRWLSVLSALTVAPLAGLATPLASPWHDVRVKHAWKAVPDNWESLGPPPPGTATDLYVALRPHHEDALIDALYEVSTPGHPKFVLSITPPPWCTYMCRCTFEDMAHTFQRRGLPSLSRRTQTRSS